MTAFVSLTFDDGWKSAVELGAPILERAGLRGTFYVMTTPPEMGFPLHAYAAPDAVYALQAAGQEIGSHTIFHPHLPALSRDAARREIFESAELLRMRGVQIDTFAYPYGEYTSALVDVVRDAGYLGARCTRSGFNYASTDRFLLNCRTVAMTTPVESVIHWIDATKARDRWLILMFHQIEATRTALGQAPLGTTTEVLAEIVAHLGGAGIEVVAIRDGLRRFFN
ncbi:MAG: polysaccharide deacetylase family protein [Xanthobacteraceae bacterium]